MVNTAETITTEVATRSFRLVGNSAQGTVRLQNKIQRLETIRATTLRRGHGAAYALFSGKSARYTLDRADLLRVGLLDGNDTRSPSLR